ncbi:MAG TPA: hypothetical protein VMU10_02000 [Desulfomonilia bacterium]|nr:hypothetical protein [Desulfomonilia bacterium]
MSLPKKRKKLNENQAREKEATGRIPASTRGAIPEISEDVTEPSSSRNQQMQKAFEVVEHIEHTDETTGGGLNRVEKTAHSPVQERLCVRLNFDTTLSGDAGKFMKYGDETPPFIEVRLRIPSFFWKVPLIKNLTMNLIRRFTKE